MLLHLSFIYSTKSTCERMLCSTKLKSQKVFFQESRHLSGWVVFSRGFVDLVEWCPYRNMRPRVTWEICESSSCMSSFILWYSTSILSNRCSSSAGTQDAPAHKTHLSFGLEKWGLNSFPRQRFTLIFKVILGTKTRVLCVGNYGSSVWTLHLPRS